MPIDPSIPLSVRPPQYEQPLSMLGQITQIRDAASQIGLRNAQTQAAQQQAQDLAAQAEERRNGLRAQNTFMEKMKDPAVNARVHQEDYSDLEGVIPPKYLMPIKEAAANYLKTKLTNTLDQNKIQTEALSHVVETAKGLLLNPDGTEKPLATINSQLPGAVQELTTAGWLQKAGIKSSMPSNLTSTDGLKQFLANIGGEQAVTDKAIALQGEQSKMAETAAKTAKDVADTTKTKLETDVLQQRLAALKDPATAQRLMQQIDSEIPAGRSQLYADENNKAKQAVVGALASGSADALDKAQKAITDSADRIGRHEAGVAQAKETAPTKISIMEAGQAARNKYAGAKPATFYAPDETGVMKAVSVRPGDEIPPGAVSAAGLSSLNVPTSQTRSMAEMAPRVLELAARMKQLISTNESQLGPLAGRWSEFTAGKIGVPNQGYTQLRTDAALLSTALMRMHVGARGGSQIMEHFTHLVDVAKQSPENLKAGIDEIIGYANQVKGEGGVKNSPAPKGDPLGIR